MVQDVRVVLGQKCQYLLKKDGKESERTVGELGLREERHIGHCIIMSYTLNVLGKAHIWKDVPPPTQVYP